MLLSTSESHAEPVIRWPAAIPPHSSLQRSVYLKQDERALFVSTEVSENDIHLLSFVSRLRQSGFEFKVFRLGPREFEEAMENASANISNSQIQAEVSELLARAVKEHASDIHIDILTRNAQVEFRLGGLILSVEELRVDRAQAWLQVIYNTMCHDTQSSHIPDRTQDGQFSPEFLPERIEGIRLNRGPTSVGEYMALRLHWESFELQGSFRERLKKLGYSDYHIAVLNYARERPKGMIIFAGTTGSGKTTTLKHAVECSAQDFPGLKYITVEDPVEIRIPGVRQLPVIRSNDDLGDAQKFNEKLISVLRQDPDRLMVGEIRDHQTAKLCVDATQSGHQLMTTLHAGSPFGIVERFANLLRRDGDPQPYHTLCSEDILIALIHQSLIPTLCEHCKIPLEKVIDDLPQTQQKRLGKAFPNGLNGIFLSNPEGCKECNGFGHSGRTVVAEIVPMDRKILRILRNKGADGARMEWIKRNGENHFERTLQGHARQKVVAGLVDPIQVIKFIGPLVYDELMRDEMLDEEEIDLWREECETKA